MVFNFSLFCNIRFSILGRFLARSPSGTVFRFLLLWTCILYLNGCAATRDYLVSRGPDTVQKNQFLIDKEDDVVGRLATIRLKKGDTLPDIARHFSLGTNTISAVNPGVDLWVPEPGQRIVLPMSFILPDARRKGIVINLAAMRLFLFKKDGNRLGVSTYPVGVGAPDRPTPRGRMYITRKKFRPTWYVPASIAAAHRKKGDPLPAVVPPGPQNPLGEHALYLSRSSYLIHGTNKPASVGLRATNGCLRLYPEDVKQLFEETALKTRVKIVNQPFLIGRRDGTVYLEAHTPFDKSGTAELKKLFAKLKKIDKETGHSIDWEKVEKVVAETHGVPVAVSVNVSEDTIAAVTPIKIRHPGKLYGRPQVSELRSDAWYVLAAILSDKVEARRLAAIINHQGPHIPARVLSKRSKHRVLAGPFNNSGEAEVAAKRLRIDLELDGVLVAPVEQN